VIVLHVAAPAAVGGLERVVQSLAIGQQAHRITSHVAAVLSTAEHPFLDPLQAAGIPVHPILAEGRAYRRERARMAALCREIMPDVVHTHGYRPDVVDAPVARALGIPTVTTLHGFTGGGWRNRFFERLQRSACRRFHAVVAVSRPLAAQLIRRRVPSERLHVVPNAWREWKAPLDRAAARRQLGIDRDSFVVGWVGRLGPEKGPDLLVKAMPYLSPVNATASIIGAGPERARLEALAIRLGVRDRIRWHGEVLEAGRLFRAFDVFVLSSRTEGTPLVLFEAMAAGVPIVASAVGGVPDVVSSREALLIPPEDAGQLAWAVCEARTDTCGSERRVLAARARLSAEFDFPQWIGRYQAIYERLIKAARARDTVWV
jgi:glycosyltransferase involved in cell wall biosynthesis